MNRPGLYSIRDTKAENYTHPWAAPNDAFAERYFRDVCNDQQTIYGKHPDDFQLFRVGNFNQETGELTQEPHQLLAHGRTS